MQKQNRQATVYYIHDCIIGHKPMLVGKAQIIKFFANNKIQKAFELNSWFKLNQEDLQIISNKKYKNAHVWLDVDEITNPSDLYFKRNQYGFISLCGNWEHKRELNQGDLINLILRGQEFYHEKELTEKWPGQTRYLAVTNEFGHELKVPIKDTVVNITTPYHIANHTPHAIGFQMKKMRRATHTRSAFAKSNYKTIRHMDVDREYFHKFKHINRSYTRKHIAHFPVWDDSEYLVSRHSTGWKHQRKNRKQYDVPIKAHQDTIKISSIKQ